MIGIGDFDGKSRNTRKVITRAGQVMFNGKKYAQDKNTGYFVCTTIDKSSGIRKRLHVAIWEHEHGCEVPPGCVIHHKDWCKTNNSVDNLTCVTIRDHERIHNHKKGEKIGEILDYVTGDVIYCD